VQCHVAEPFASAYPTHFGARLSVVLPDGRECAHAVTDARGDPELALPPQALFDKAAALMAYGEVPRPRIAMVLRAAAELIDAVDVPSGQPMPEAFTDPLW
jgi:hypothetical protein